VVQVRMTKTQFREKLHEFRREYDLDLTEPAGRVTKQGVTAGYTHHHETLTVHILDKPVFISTEYCEQQLQELLTPA